MKPWQFFLVLIAAIAAIAFFSLQSQPQKVPFSNAELAGNSIATGPADAKVTIVEFSDYQCPACLTAHNNLKQVLPEFEGKVRFVYRNFPLYTIHPNAIIAAEAALAAGEQGKFLEMHDKLFESQETIKNNGKTELLQIAKDLGLDTAKFNGALSSRKFAPIVLNDMNDAQKFGVEGTPTFFINGQKYFGALSTAKLKEIIGAELKK